MRYSLKEGTAYSELDNADRMSEYTRPIETATLVIDTKLKRPVGFNLDLNSPYLIKWKDEWRDKWKNE